MIGTSLEVGVWNLELLVRVFEHGNTPDDV